jgi:hypothetical protein
VISQNNDFSLQFVPKDFQYLTQQKYLEYKGVKLKTAYLIDIIHQLLQKYYFSNASDIKFNLSSVILKNKYCEYYNYCIQYLCEVEFITLSSKYYVGKKTNTYKINTKHVYDVVRYKNYDKLLLKKDKNRNEITITEMNSNIIPISIKTKLVESLNMIDIDYESSVEYLNELKDNELIDDCKYQKNLMSIENINSKNIYFNFDDYGRFHTNFTILKK